MVKRKDLSKRSHEVQTLEFAKQVREASSTINNLRTGFEAQVLTLTDKLTLIPDPSPSLPDSAVRADQAPSSTRTKCPVEYVQTDGNYESSIGNISIHEGIVKAVDMVQNDYAALTIFIGRKLTGFAHVINRDLGLVKVFLQEIL